MTYADILAEDLDCGPHCPDWVTREGREMHIHQMANRHLENAIKLLHEIVIDIGRGGRNWLSPGDWDWTVEWDAEMWETKLHELEYEAERRGMTVEVD